MEESRTATASHREQERLLKLLTDSRLSAGVFASGVVAGDAGRNQARGYTNNHKQGPPVSKAIKLPSRWKELLET